MKLNGQKTMKQRLNEGEFLFGTFYKFCNPQLVEMLGYAGMDFVLIDGEHSDYSYRDFQDMIRVANGVGLNAVVRVPSSAEEHILHAADAGAQGVQIPSMDTVEEAFKATKHMRYYPIGDRGFGLTTRAARYSFCDAQEYMDYVNKDLLSVVMVENLYMADHVKELCEIPFIDVLFIGPGDLSQACGVPGQTSHPKVLEVAKKICDGALAGGKKVGVYAATLEDVDRYMSWGVQYIAHSAELNMIAGKFKQVVGDLHALREKHSKK